jgi:acyl-CoA thioesterase-1
MANMSHSNDLTRRDAIAVAAAATLVPTAAAAAARKIVTLLGDSITAGYGLSASVALPAQLQAQIDALHAPAIIRNAGVSGDTTASGLARVDRSVRADTDICVVALGGNDLLQLTDPRVTRANLDKIIRRLKARHIEVLLVGVGAPPELGSYARAFNAVFSDLAREHGIPLYADILAGVARDRALNQADGIHPNARGVAVIARRLAPVIRDAVRRA